MENQTNHGKTARQASEQADIAPSAGIVRDDLLEVLWRSRWLVLLTTALAMGAGLIYVTAATPMYTSTSKLYVEQNSPRILKEADPSARGAAGMAPSKNCLYTQATLLTSTPILTAAVEKPDVRELKVFQKVTNPIVWLKDKGLRVSVGKTDDIILLPLRFSTNHSVVKYLKIGRQQSPQFLFPLCGMIFNNIHN